MNSEDVIGVGSELGGFKLERELGRGGMGVVYKAHELSLNRKVALKVLSQRLSSDAEFIERFKREAQVIAALNHPNIVGILSYGEAHGRHYFAMEYIPGKDLGQVLKEKGSIPLDEALSITSQVAGALAVAGEKGVVHRDLKPSNIMLDDMGKAKVTDFGVAHFQDSGAKLTQTGLFLGTPEYASPEQAAGRSLDVRSDIYALGAVLYRMLSGKPPITGESPLAVVTKIATEPVTPIGQVNTALPRSVCQLIDKMMAKALDERFQRPQEVAAAVDRCLDELKSGKAVPAAAGDDRGVGPPPLPKKGAGGRGKVWGGVIGVALAVLLIVWLVEGGFLGKEGVQETGTPHGETPASDLAAVPAEPVSPEAALKDEISPEAAAQRAPETVQAPKTAQVAAAKTPPLPKVPTVLMVVSGEQSLVPLVRANLESAVAASGLPVAAVSEIPVLREKMQFGETPVSWYDIRELIPRKRIQLLLLGEVQKTGSMNLNYYGRTREMTTATFSLRAVDADTGVSAAMPASGAIKFTSLNMTEQVQKAVASAASGMGSEMKEYWREKLKTGGAG
jgi:predicted Ser/Thr protein kinase